MAIKSSAPSLRAMIWFRLSLAEDKKTIGTLEMRRSSRHQ